LDHRPGWPKSRTLGANRRSTSVSIHHLRAVPTRVLVISNYSDPIFPIRPEAEIFLGLLRMGFEIHVITPEHSTYASYLKETGAHIYNYKPEGKFDLKAVRMIRQIVKKNSIQIVHAFNSKAIACSVWALLGTKTKLVTYRGYTGNIRWYDPALYLTFLSPRIDYMVCLAESVREEYLRNGVDSKRAVTINKGHNRTWYDIIPRADLSELAIPPTSLTMSFVANKRTRMKGVIHLIEAMNKIPVGLDIFILMIGNGLKTPDVEKALEQSAYKDRFLFTGYRQDAAELVRASNLSISVSLFGEATQKAMIEAMYLGNPVIISDISGNRGMVEDGIGGYIVPSGNSSAIAESLLKFIHLSIPERQEMGYRAQQHIQSFLGLDKTIGEYAAFYERITQSEQ